MSRYRLAIGATLLALCLAAGWVARGWYEDAQRLTAERATQQAIDAAMARESEIAAVVEQRLAELQANERVIDRGIIREIEKPIYRRVCLEPDAIRLLNHAAAGTQPDTAEPDASLPERTAGAD
ncbi:hypothetical protein ACM26W_01315 [Halomonas sp. HK25]|uniref:hypothetical protein n=1 Tax=Halomonas sp. HK25 TaxID=3394321 RepID=UPI0039FDCA52